MKDYNCVGFYLLYFPGFSLLPCHIKAESQIKDGIAYACGNNNSILEEQTKIRTQTRTGVLRDQRLSPTSYH